MAKMEHMNRSRTRRMCIDCFDLKIMAGRGLCYPCWHARDLAGTLTDLPFRPEVIERYEEYLYILKNNPGITAKELARRMGINPKTIDRYKAHRIGRTPIKCLVNVGL